MTDSCGDGICCQEGNGQFAVTLNGNTVVTGGEFSDSTAKAFDIGSASTVGSSSVSGSGSASVEYHVDVTYDNYPSETRWFLKQVSTVAIIVEYGFDEVNQEGFFLSESVDLVPGER
jgi:hypothetical protein